MKTQGVGSFKTDMVRWEMFLSLSVWSSDWKRLEVIRDTAVILVFQEQRQLIHKCGSLKPLNTIGR